MEILNSLEMRKIENQAFASGITELELMKVAGQKCADKIIKEYDLPVSNKKIVVVCGNGKNGGDGFVIAKKLKKIGCNLKIVLADKEPTTAECQSVFSQTMEAEIEIVSFLNEKEKCFESADLIVDCVFGIGFHGKANGLFINVFNGINSSNAQVVAIDVPSGTDSTSGAVCETAVQADLTLAISSLKFSHVLPPSNEYCGKIKVIDIGIDRKFFPCASACVNTIERKQIKENFAKRNYNSNKGNFGKLLTVCGSYKMPGAAVISGKSAVLSGAGLVTVAFPKSAYPAITANLIETTFLPLPETVNGTVESSAKGFLIEAIEKATTLLIGCGIGAGNDVEQIVKFALEKANCPIVLDADGINALGGCINLLREKSIPVVLTPHPGEMANLVGESINFVQKHRIDLALQVAQSFNAIVVLKGANTVVTDGKSVFVNRTGNPGMAKAGTGDMLAGMISSFIAQGMSPLEASKTAVYVHGECGDICQRELSQRGMTVSDMLELLPALLSNYE